MSRSAVRRPRARRDIIEQALYISAAAERFQDAIEEAEQMLTAMPRLGAPRPFRRLKGLRMWQVRGFEKHLIFYRPIKGGIEVIRVLHASRDLVAVLDEDSDA
jgi:toxin ParE1/3/4